MVINVNAHVNRIYMGDALFTWRFTLLTTGTTTNGKSSTPCVQVAFSGSHECTLWRHFRGPWGVRPPPGCSLKGDTQKSVYYLYIISLRGLAGYEKPQFPNSIRIRRVFDRFWLNETKKSFIDSYIASFIDSFIDSFIHSFFHAFHSFGTPRKPSIPPFPDCPRIRRVFGSPGTSKMMSFISQKWSSFASF